MTPAELADRIEVLTLAAQTEHDIGIPLDQRGEHETELAKVLIENVDVIQTALRFKADCEADVEDATAEDDAPIE